MPLFGNKPAASVTIMANKAAPLSKDQKAFNMLIKKIESRRATLAEWEAALPQIQQQAMDELVPMQKKLADLQWELVVTLDAAHGTRNTTKTEKRKLAAMIVEMTEAMLAVQDDEQVKALFNKHAQTDFDEEEAERLAVMKAILEGTLGVDLGEEEPDSADELLSRMQNHFEAAEQAHQNKAASRKMSAKQLAKAEKREAEEKQLSQSIREVFRKLASALHPDREPDPTERERKTALMQRVNEAYEKSNLLQLLELQLEVEQIDQAHLANVDPERLKRYIKILKGQLQDLDAEIENLSRDIAANLGLSPFEHLDPNRLKLLFRHDLANIKAQIVEVRHQLKIAQDAGQLKNFLKNITLTRRRADDFDFAF